MFSATTSSRRHATPRERVTAALPDLPGRRRKRRRNAAAIAIARTAAVPVLLLGVTAAVQSRVKLASVVSHDDGSGQPALFAAEE
jgi:hypothetical protein